MRICYVQPYCPRNADTAPSDYLARYPLLLHLPRQVAARGHDVDVVVQHPHDAEHHERGVRYHFVCERQASASIGRALARAARRPPSHLIPARSTIARATELDPDLVHIHGFVPHLSLMLIDAALSRHGTPWVAQHHGGAAARSWLARRLQSRWMRGPAALVFTAREHAASYIERGLLRDDDERLTEIVETSSPFQRADRGAARQRTGLDGNPVLVSVARLHPVKDPLTVLRGIEAMIEALPDARLHCVYRDSELLQEVSSFLRSRPRLATRVTLHGEASQEDMEDVYNSADFLLQASVREFSGCAVLEAMSCGVIPVITDIPAFRKILGDDLSNLRFPVGDAAALARRVQTIWESGPGEVAERVVGRFERRLSFAAMARQLETVYEGVVSRRSSSSR